MEIQRNNWSFLFGLLSEGLHREGVMRELNLRRWTRLVSRLRGKGSTVINSLAMSTCISRTPHIIWYGKGAGGLWQAVIGVDYTVSDELLGIISKSKFAFSLWLHIPLAFSFTVPCSCCEIFSLISHYLSILPTTFLLHFLTLTWFNSIIEGLPCFVNLYLQTFLYNMKFQKKFLNPCSGPYCSGPSRH